MILIEKINKKDYNIYVDKYINIINNIDKNKFIYKTLRMSAI